MGFLRGCSGVWQAWALAELQAEALAELQAEALAELQAVALAELQADEQRWQQAQT